MVDFLTPEYYQRIARTLEDGKIQIAFFDDRLALPDLYTGDHAEAVGAGVRASRRFVLAASSMPGAYDDLVRLLVPELRRRGLLLQKEYAGPTLRDNLGLPIPRAADWHAARRRAVE
jgi:hypothetical protein